jgi:hypothetical protein
MFGGELVWFCVKGCEEGLCEGEFGHLEVSSGNEGIEVEIEGR